MNSEDMARPADQALAVPVEPASGLAPSGFDPSRIEEAIRGHEAVAEYFGVDPAEAATTMAWHAGYEAGATEQAAFSAGVAHAEQQIIEWLLRQWGGAWEVVHNLPDIGAVHVPRVLAREISRCAHRDTDEHPEGAKLTADAVIYMRKSGESTANLADRFNVNWKTAWAARTRRSWKFLP